MSVISRNRTQELYLLLLTPRRVASDAVHHRSRDQIVHDTQTRIAKYHHMVDRAFHEFRKERLRFPDPVKGAVISEIHFIFTLEHRLAVEYVEHVDRQIELVCRRFSARHVEFYV